MRTANEEPLKAIILAARPDTSADTPYFKILEPLGDQKIVDYVIDTALEFVSPEDLYVVVGYAQDDVKAHLAERFRQKALNYVEQGQLSGTGNAVLQVTDHIPNYEGDLLILYGDTPLLRRSSIRGLLNRHWLKEADLTLFTAFIPQPNPYGRIIRGASGRIVDIIEMADAPSDVQAIEEVNAGAYVACAQTLFQALQRVEQSAAGGESRLTDTVHQLIRAGHHIASYRSYDPDEIHGINTPADLEEAEFILQKRYFQPFRQEEKSEIRFGTGGWRATIGEGFTMYNVRRLCQALANQITRKGQEPQGVLIGYDRRFLSDKAAEVAAEIFAGNNVPVLLLAEDAPTPLITYATAAQGCSLGLVFTASHNPPDYNGLKVFRQDGSLLLTSETNRIEQEANRLTEKELIKIELTLALEAEIVRRVDYTNEYVDAVEDLIDMQAIRQAGLRVVLDPMFGVSQLTLETILVEARCRVTTIRGRHDPLFGGRSPAPDLHALGLLIATTKDGQYDLGMATDGDADRIAIVDEQGNFIHINDVLLLLYYYLHEVRELRGGVVRNLATTHLLDRLADHFGETCHETPVGFKHIITGMQAHDALLGGESSGGLTIRGHILGKDGIFAAALMVEMLAKTGRKISQLLAEIYAITGRLYAIEENIPATSEMKILVPKRLQEAPLSAIGPYAVQEVSHLDGTKFLLENDNWLLLRFSGTEPVLRIFAEADSAEKTAELVAWAKEQVALK